MAKFEFIGPVAKIEFENAVFDVPVTKSVGAKVDEYGRYFALWKEEYIGSPSAERLREMTDEAVNTARQFTDELLGEGASGRITADRYVLPGDYIRIGTHILNALTAAAQEYAALYGRKTKEDIT